MILTFLYSGTACNIPDNPYKLFVRYPCPFPVVLVNTTSILFHPSYRSKITEVVVDATAAH